MKGERIQKTMIYKRYHLKPGVISCVPEGDDLMCSGRGDLMCSGRGWSHVFRTGVISYVPEGVISYVPDGGYLMCSGRG